MGFAPYQDDRCTRRDNEYTSPNVGGCWICQTDRGGVMEFDMEFDTFYHIDCLEKSGCESILEYEKEK